jgi:predicted  nucleic acid-binding Zn-ribbon protein
MRGMDRLLKLQEIDTALDRLRARREALESGATLAAARETADAAERHLGELRLRADEMGRDQIRFEQEIDSLTSKEAAEQQRMYDGSIVNAKELEALQHEIDNVKKRRSDREDELLALMEQREALDARIADADSEASALRTSVEATSSRAAEELVSATANLASLEAERETLIPAFDPELLELYEDLRRQKKGIGAAPLVDGVCQGCHEQLSSVVLDRLKHTDGIRRCEHCRRILVF